MALTANSDIMGRFKETAFNTILHEVMIQNPKTFNYATQQIINSNSYCSPITVHPDLSSTSTEICTEVDKMPIVGTNSDGFDFCIQLKELKVDFNPSSVIQLPPELGNLAIQQFALKGKVCAGLKCSESIPSLVLDNNAFIDKVRSVNTKKITNSKTKEFQSLNKGMIFRPLNLLNMTCFCLNLYAKVILVKEKNKLKLKLIGIEIEDMTPIGLENMIECYLKQVLDQAVFPKLKIALEDLVFNAGDYFSIGLTPTSSAIPHNPDVSNDYLSIFLNIN